MKNKIPKFKSEKEEAKFWSEHSPLEFSDELIEVEKPFQFDPELLKKMAKKHIERKKSLTLRMETSLVLLAKIIANEHGNHYQTLLRSWIRERVKKELKEHPEIEKKIRSQHMHLVHR